MKNSVIIILAIISSIFQLVYNTKDPNILPGRDVIVHLFEWKWKDVAKECERYLGPKGFGAIQVSPPNEHNVINEPFRPWWVVILN